MSQTAPRSTSFVKNVRSGFASGQGFSFKKNNASPLGSDPTLGSPQPVVQSDPVASTPSKSRVADQQDLHALEKIISEVEAQKVQSQIQQPVVSPPIKPVFQPQTQVQSEPQLQESPVQDPVAPIAQAVPQAVMQQTAQAQQPDPLNPQTFTPTAAAHKEQFASVTPDSSPAVEAGGGFQQVEHEKTPEIPPEVESFLQHAQDHADQLPEEIVIADNQEISKVTHYPKTPVVVLPITEEEKKEGQKKSPKHSIKWLVTWSVKMMKKFAGKIIYRQEE